MPLGNYLSAKVRRDFQAATRRRLSLEQTKDSDWESLQLAKLRPLWQDAVTDVPYYSRLVQTGQAPPDIASWDDFHSLPVLTRQELQAEPEAFQRRSKLPDGFVVTAGSTGVPVRIGMSQEERDLMRIVKLGSWQECGYTENSRLFLLWGHSHLLGRGWRRHFNDLRRKLADRVLGYRRVSAYRLDRASCLAHAEKLLQFRPDGIIGYALALDLLARYTQEFRERYHALNLRFVLSTSELLPRSDSQSLLEDVFGCPVVQEYGGLEFGQVAFKRGAGPFEVHSDVVHLECESADPEDPLSHPVLVTTLYPRYVPLFRYRAGDALRGEEVLTYGHIPRFQELAGRMHDVVRLDDGSSIHSTAIYHCIQQEPSIQNIQMLLQDDGIQIRLVRSSHADPEVDKRIRQRLGQVHPSLATSRLVDEEDLITNRAGKRRWFVDLRTKQPE